MRVSKRKNILLAPAGLVIAVLLCYMFILSPAIDRRDALTGYIKKKEQALKEVKVLKREWLVFQSARKDAESSLSRRGNNFSLLSYLEGVSRQAGIDKKIQYMKPISLGKGDGPMKPEGIEIKIEEVTVNELINLLYRIEYSGKLLNIRRMKIQRSPKGEQVLLSATLQVLTYRS